MMILGCMVPEDLAAAGDSGIFCSGIWDDLSCGHCLNTEGLMSFHEKNGVRQAAKE
ncbi:MAG: hypothetical protein UIQ90_00960 [Eisenbergiella sp.]